MVWFFERDHESLRLETRYEKDVAEYVLIMHMPDGSQQVERFTDEANFRRRLEALDQQLRDDQWNQSGLTFLRDGWKLV